MTNKRDNLATFTAIKNCIGKTVLDISRVQSYFNDIEDSDGFGDLEFHFTDNSFLTLTGIGDAESIKATNGKANIPETFNVTNNDVCSWKRLNLKSDTNWNRIIAQTLNSAEIEWNINNAGDNRIGACVLQLDSDFITFFETGSDNNKFYINIKLPTMDRATKLEKII